jgi:hypothetical protein
MMSGHNSCNRKSKASSGHPGNMRSRTLERLSDVDDHTTRTDDNVDVPEAICKVGCIPKCISFQFYIEMTWKAMVSKSKSKPRLRSPPKPLITKYGCCYQQVD